MRATIKVPGPASGPWGLQPGFRLRFQPVGLTGRRVELQLGERENQALVHPGFRSRRDLRQVSGFGCQVSVTDFDPLCRSRS
jgi:hypothetical protein